MSAAATPVVPQEAAATEESKVTTGAEALRIAQLPGEPADEPMSTYTEVNGVLVDTATPEYQAKADALDKANAAGDGRGRRSQASGHRRARR